MGNLFKVISRVTANRKAADARKMTIQLQLHDTSNNCICLTGAPEEIFRAIL